MSKKMKQKTPKQAPMTQHELGDEYFIDGVACKVKFINAGYGFLFPITDDADTPLIARHIAYARVDEDGKVKVL